MQTSTVDPRTVQRSSQDIAQPPPEKKQKVGGATSSSNSAQIAPPPAAAHQFQRAVQTANANLKGWVGKDIARVELTDDRLHAIMIDQQTKSLLGRLVDTGAELPMVQILLERNMSSGDIKQYDMPNGELTIMNACKLAVHEFKSEAKASADIATLARWKAEARDDLRVELFEFALYENAYNVLTNPMQAGRPDAYKDCTTITLMRAFQYLFENNMAGIVE